MSERPGTGSAPHVVRACPVSSTGTAAPTTLVGPLAARLQVRALPGTRDLGRAEDVPCLEASEGPGAELAAFSLRLSSLRREERAELETLGGRLAPFLPLHLMRDGAPPRDQALALVPITALTRQHACSPLVGTLHAAREALEEDPGEPLLMGVLNVTPDSFSDGGRYLDPAAAVEHGRALVAAGADVIDVGGESTRPGARPVDPGEEQRRVEPVVRELCAEGLTVSIDTRRASVARAALDAGAKLVNDVSGGLDDPALLPLVAEHGCDVVLMHMRGEPQTMQLEVTYDDPVAEVATALRQRLAAAIEAGIGAERVTLDPGIGFGKRLAHNLELVRRLPELRSLGCPLLVGVSRKSFIAHATGREAQDDFRGRNRSDLPAQRVGGTAAALAACVQGGARVLRVHDVGVMAEAAAIACALSGRPLPRTFSRADNPRGASSAPSSPPLLTQRHPQP